MKRKLFDIVDLFFRRRSDRSPDRHASGVLLISSGGLGDTILFSLVLPGFRELLQPGEQLTLLMQEGRQCLQFLLPDDIRLITVNYRRFIRHPFYRFRVSDFLRRQRYRVAITTDHLRLPTVDEAMLIATQAPEIYGLVARSWPKHNARLQANQVFFTQLFSVSPGKSHRMIRWCELLSGLLQRKIHPQKVKFPLALKIPTRELENPTVVIHPFSAVKAREFSPEIYQKCLKLIPKDFKIVISAGPGDLAARPEFNVLLQDPRVSVDNSSIQSKTSLYKSAKLVIVVDTSMLHLAAALGVPTIALVSAAHLIDSVPYDSRITPENVTFYYHSMPCEGCLGQCVLPLENNRYACVNRFNPSIVGQKIEEIFHSAFCA